MTGARILVVDDEPQIRRAVRRALEASGYEVKTAATGEEALEGLRWRPDVVLLDLILPDVNGLELVRRIREQSVTPILMLSVRGEERQKVQALDEGVDDYVSKPFGTEELLARIRVALRHSAGQAGEPVVEVDDLRIDFERRSVTRRGEEIRLTPTEYDVLKLLVQHAGKVVTHRVLLERVWGWSTLVRPSTCTSS